MSAARGPIYTPVRAADPSRRFRHDEPPKQSRHHRLHRRLSAAARRRSSRICSDDAQKASLYATIGPKGERGVALSGHTDVVPVDGQTWTSDPFTLRAEQGRLYGRGTADMKGFLAAVLVAVPDFKRRRLVTPIHLAFSYDEEVGCIGVRPMIAELGKVLPKPRMVIVGEPTSMQVVDAHKGPVRWRVDVKGRAAHSSMATLGVNAITYAARLVGEIERIEAGLKRTARNERFNPPYPTLQVTNSKGERQRISSPLLASSASRSARCPVSIRLRSKRGCGTSPRRNACPRCAPLRRKPTSRSRRRTPYRLSVPTRTPRS